MNRFTEAAVSPLALTENRQSEVLMRIRHTLFALPLLGLVLAACGATAGQATTNGATTTVPTVKVSQTAVGQVLADQTGRTLYAFTKDKDKPAACDADCVAVWPVMAGKAAAGDGVTASLLGEAKESDSLTQVTYKGWPLYYYVGDSVPGDVNGTGIDTAWFPLSPDGSLLKTQP
ncbi:MAG: lipoprotein [Amycolatopsis sp.]|nr:lipoprotein [Amycolatopsis sp.]